MSDSIINYSDLYNDFLILTSTSSQDTTTTVLTPPDSISSTSSSSSNPLPSIVYEELPILIQSSIGSSGGSVCVQSSKYYNYNNIMASTPSPPIQTNDSIEKVLDYVNERRTTMNYEVEEESSTGSGESCSSQFQNERSENIPEVEIGTPCMIIEKPNPYCGRPNNNNSSTGQISRHEELRRLLLTPCGQVRPHHINQQSYMNLQNQNQFHHQIQQQTQQLFQHQHQQQHPYQHAYQQHQHMYQQQYHQQYENQQFHNIWLTQQQQQQQQQQHQQQQQQHHQHPPIHPPIYPPVTLSLPTVPNEIKNPRPLWLGRGEPPIYPGGLEVLWREVSSECQKLLNPEDIPGSARFRGYFTVSELLALKRLLVSRLNGMELKPYPLVSGSKRTSASFTSTMAAAESCAGPSIGSVPIVGFNGAIQEALGVLDENQIGNNSGSRNQQWNENNNMTRPKTPTGMPPPYRTVTIVLKLLQIGNYFFRSFSDLNPNRCRVLFNTQHFLYECHLPIVPPVKDGFQPLRKLLTIDIRFDQISMIRFGADKLFLRVEGAPQMTVTYIPVTEDDESSTLPLTPEDEHLLDQIEKGQLKLSPCHQLYFLNERLVHTLKLQLREQPMFENMINHIEESLLPET